MNRTSLLILKTSCDFSALGNESSVPSFGGETHDQSDREIAMTGLVSKSPLICDVVLLPSTENDEEVPSQAESEDSNDKSTFLESHDTGINVISFISQPLLPCGIDNLLQWSSYSVDSYLLSVSNCVMDVSQSTFDSTTASPMDYQIPLLSSGGSFQSVQFAESSNDLQVSQATQDIILAKSSLDSVWSKLSIDKENKIHDRKNRTVNPPDDTTTAHEVSYEPLSAATSTRDPQQSNPISVDHFWRSMCLEPQLASFAKDDRQVTTALLEQSEELRRTQDRFAALNERIRFADTSTRKKKIELIEKRLEEELACIQMIFYSMVIIPAVALFVVGILTLRDYRCTRRPAASPSRKRHSKFQRRDIVDFLPLVSHNSEEPMDAPMPSIAVHTEATTDIMSSVSKSEEQSPLKEACNEIRSRLSRTKHTFNLAQEMKQTHDVQSQSSEEPTQETNTQEPMSPRTLLMTQFEQKHPNMKATSLGLQQESVVESTRRSRNRLQPPMPITPDTISRESPIPSSKSSTNSLESGFFFSRPPSEIETVRSTPDAKSRLQPTTDDREQPMPTNAGFATTFVDDYW